MLNLNLTPEQEKQAKQFLSEKDNPTVGVIKTILDSAGKHQRKAEYYIKKAEQLIKFQLKNNEQKF